MKRIFILFLFSIITNLAFAVQVQVEHVNTQAGLAYNSVYSIYEDEHGFIWAATINGLNRYDGTSVRVFEPGNSKDLAENNIKMITGDRNGHLFVKGFEGLYLYDMRKDKFTLIKNSGVDVIYYASDVLYYSSEGRVLRYNITSGKSEVVFTLRGVSTSLHINALAVDSDGSFYVGTERSGFYVVDARGEITRHLSYGTIRSIYIDPQDNVWLSMNGQGLRMIDKVRGDITEYRRRSRLGQVELSSNFVREVQQRDSTHYYVATSQGLSILNTTTGTFEPYTYDDCLLFSVPSLLTIMLDTTGKLWLGSYYEGLQLYNPDQTHQRYYLPGGDNMHHNVQMSYVVNNIIEGEDGCKWMATEGGGVVYLKNGDNQIRSAAWNDKLFSLKAKALYLEGDTLWVTSDDGVCKVNLLTGSVVKITTELMVEDGTKIRCGDIISITRHEKNLYCGTNQGVLVIDTADNSISMLEFDHLSEKRFHVWDILFDNDDMWITTSTDLYRYNPRSRQTNIYTRYTTNNGSNKNHFFKALKDDAGRIWFTSSGMGIFLYDQDTDAFINYGKEGLLSGYVTGICKSPNEERLILSTIEGISTFDIETKQFENYNESNGFPFSSVSSSGLFISTTDELFALSSNSVIRMPLSELCNKPYNHRIYFTSISIDNQEVLPGEDGVLSESLFYQREVSLHGDSSVSFTVRDNDFSSASISSNLEYRLMGFDREFKSLSNSGVISYSSLAPGNYELVVRSKASDRDGVVHQATMQVKVRGNIIYSRGFVIFCIISIIVLFCVVYIEHRRRIGTQGALATQRDEHQSVERSNDLKFNLFTRVAHQFRTPLTLVHAQLEYILEQRSVSPEIYSKILSAYRSSQKMEQLVNEIIDVSRWEHDEVTLDLRTVEMNGYVENIYLSFEEYARGRGVVYRFEPAGEEVKCDVDMVEFEKVINNIISNAFGYAVEGGELVVRIEAPAEGGDKLKIIISNSGAYFSAEDLPHLFDRYYTPEARGEKPLHGVGMGLSMVKDIVDMHGGQISVDSSEQRGTTFAFELRVSDKSIDEDSVVQTVDYTLTDEEVESLGQSFGQKMPVYKAKIIIVEDNDELRAALERIFSTIYEVHTASDGAECLSMVGEVQPDIILSDVSMPNMFGTAMCAAIKGDHKTSHIPVILFSENSSEEAIIEGFIHGADDYIIKPFNTKLLIARCNSFIINRHRLRDRHQDAVGEELTPQLLTSNMEDLELITKAEEVVKRHIGSADFDAHAFAVEMGLCRTYLFSKIKSVTGLTPNEFILNMRMKAGMLMLQENPHITVTSLAYDCGFNSSSYFIRCFKSLYGKTPNMYKKELLEELRASKKGQSLQE